MAEFKIASMNVRGIGNNNKRRETFNWLRNKQQSRQDKTRQLY